MEVLIIGSGKQGSDITKYLVNQPDVTHIRLTDIDLDIAKKAANNLNSEKVSSSLLDAGKSQEISKAAKGFDVVVNAVIPIFNLSIMNGAFKAKANYVDLASGPPYDNIEKQLNLNEKWEKAELTALMNTGVSPGVTSVLIADCADELDQVDEINIIGGSMIKPGTDFLEGKEILTSTWSPVTFWSDMLSPPLVFEDGEWKTVPPFSGEEVYEFPEPLGSCTVVDHVHEEVYTIPRFIKKGLKKMHVKFGWFPDLFIAKAISELGLWSDKPIDVKGVKVAPRDLLLKLVKPIPTTDELAKKIEERALLENVGASIIEVKGVKDGVKTTYKCYSRRSGGMGMYEAYDKYGKSYLERPGITGVSAAIFTQMIGQETLKKKGVFPPEALSSDERKIFRERLAEQGFAYNVSIEKRII